MKKPIIAKYVRNHKVVFEKVICEIISTQATFQIALCHDTNQYGTLFLNWYDEYVFVPQCPDCNEVIA